MELDGKFAKPDCEYERWLLGVDGDIEITPELDVRDLLSTVRARRVELQNRKAADDDELTHDQRAALPADEVALVSDEKYAKRVVDTIFVKQLELYPELLDGLIKE